MASAVRLPLFNGAVPATKESRRDKGKVDDSAHGDETRPPEPKAVGPLEAKADASLREPVADAIPTIVPHPPRIPSQIPPWQEETGGSEPDAEAGALDLPAPAAEPVAVNPGPPLPAEPPRDAPGEPAEQATSTEEAVQAMPEQRAAPEAVGDDDGAGDQYALAVSPEPAALSPPDDVPDPPSDPPSDAPGDAAETPEAAAGDHSAIAVQADAPERPDDPPIEVAPEIPAPAIAETFSDPPAAMHHDIDHQPFPSALADEDAPPPEMAQAATAPPAIDDTLVEPSAAPFPQQHADAESESAIDTAARPDTLPPPPPREPADEPIAEIPAEVSVSRDAPEEPPPPETAAIAAATSPGPASLNEQAPTIREDQIWSGPGTTQQNPWWSERQPADSHQEPRSPEDRARVEPELPPISQLTAAVAAIPPAAIATAASSPSAPLPSADGMRAVAPRLRFAARLAGAVVLMLAGAVLFLIVLYRWVDPPASTLMIGQRLTGTAIEQKWVPLDRISPNLIQAVMLSEDGAFCRHSGVDWSAMEEAIESSRGGSTITMQVVKNLFLWPSRSYIRKALEIALAYVVEVIWSKERILEIYLNIAEWGPGVFGAEAAARNHFGKSASRLTAQEAALLAVSLPSPIERQASYPGWQMRRLADNLLIRMRAVRTTMRCVRPRRGGA